MNEFPREKVVLRAGRIAGIMRLVEYFNGRFPVRGKRILEIGSDRALFVAEAFRKLGAEHVVASNMASNWESMHDYAVKHIGPGVSAMLADARDLEAKVEKESMDAVFAIAFAEHAFDPQKIVEQIDKVLVPGGYALIHGNPIWSGPCGHHLFVKGQSRLYRFADGKDWIPDWHHLFWSKDEMVEHLLDKDVPQADALVICESIYTSDSINRFGYRSLVKQYSNGPLQCVDLIEQKSKPPSSEVLARILSGPWGDQARYEVNGIGFLLHKPQQ